MKQEIFVQLIINFYNKRKKNCQKKKEKEESMKSECVQRQERKEREKGRTQARKKRKEHHLTPYPTRLKARSSRCRSFPQFSPIRRQGSKSSQPSQPSPRPLQQTPWEHTVPLSLSSPKQRPLL